MSANDVLAAWGHKCPQSRAGKPTFQRVPDLQPAKDIRAIFENTGNQYTGDQEDKKENANRKKGNTKK